MGIWRSSPSSFWSHFGHRLKNSPSSYERFMVKLCVATAAEESLQNPLPRHVRTVAEEIMESAKEGVVPDWAEEGIFTSMYPHIVFDHRGDLQRFTFGYLAHWGQNFDKMGHAKKLRFFKRVLEVARKESVDCSDPGSVIGICDAIFTSAAKGRIPAWAIDMDNEINIVSLRFADLKSTIPFPPEEPQENRPFDDFWTLSTIGAALVLGLINILYSKLFLMFPQELEPPPFL